ncbi:hypothetical protein MHK_007147 [Candidatus Magnetomorum sp. HK-1]|nr:hypothetical protein MHK_007147 [Candidatus Magnetomorum sp. HK-1]
MKKKHYLSFLSIRYYHLLIILSFFLISTKPFYGEMNPPGNALYIHKPGNATYEWLDLADGNYDTITNQVTIEFWACGDPSTGNSFDSLFLNATDISNSIVFTIQWPSGNVTFVSDPNNLDTIYYQASSTEYKNYWNHWAFVKDGVNGIAQIYLNGRLVNERTTSVPTINGAGIDSFRIGASSSGWTYTGQLDEFRIWSVARTEQQIQESMNIPLSGNEYGLVSYFNFDQSTGNTLPNLANLNKVNNGVMEYMGTRNWVSSGAKMISKQFPPGNALNFPGDVNAYVDVSNTDYSQITENLTVEFWCFGDNNLNGQSTTDILRFSNNLSQAIIGINLPWNGVVYFDAPFNLNRLEKPVPQADEYKYHWIHWAFVKKASTGEMKIYKNGILWESKEGMTLPIPTADITSFKIGSGYSGRIDELRIWSTARTEHQIKNNYKTILSGNEQGLVSYYNFDLINGNKLENLADLSSPASLINLTETALVSSNADVQMPKLMVPPGNALKCNINESHVDAGNTYNPGLYSSIRNKVTIEFWAYGEPGLTFGGNFAFLATDAQGNRILSAHLPLFFGTSGVVYFDAPLINGDDATTDRISAGAQPHQYRGQWNHWAFVKNIHDGTMYIYLNGSYFHHGTGHTTPIDGQSIVNFRIGYSYYGRIDEFRLWTSARTEQQIKDNYMNFNISPSDPDLLVYFKFDHTEGDYADNIATKARKFSDAPGGLLVGMGSNPWVKSGAIVQINPVGTYIYYDKFNFPVVNATDSAVTRMRTDTHGNLITEVAMIIDHDFTGSKSGGYFDNIANPSYSTGKHWIIQNRQVSDINIDAYVPHEFKFDTRYVLDSYTIDNDSGKNTNILTSLPPIDNPAYTIAPVTLSSSTKITFKWKTQHSVEVLAVPSLENSNMDQISLTVLFNPNQLYQSNHQGTGTWWYDKGTILQSSATHLTNPCPLMCKGYFDNSDPTNATINPLRTKTIPGINTGLTKGVVIIWKYDTPTYKEKVIVGNPVSLRNVSKEHKSFIDLSKEPTILSTTNNDKFYYWDDVEKKLYPLIGNRSFLVEWHSKSNINCNGKIVSQISTLWPGSDKKQTQYKHIANTSPVILDPDPNDDILFNSLQYTEGDGAVSQNGEFTAKIEGRSVLLFDLIKPVIKDKPNNKVLYYDFNQSSGTTVEDKSGNGNHGRLVNIASPSWVSSLPNKNNALELIGDGYVDISSGDYSSIQDKFTIEFWSKGSSNLDDQSKTFIFHAKNSSNKIMLNAHLPWDRRVYFYAPYNCGIQNRIHIEVQQNVYKSNWNHWAFVKDADTGIMNIYLNGDLLHNDPNMNMITKINGADIHNFRLGGYDPPSQNYKGTIDEFRIWNIPRTQKEIQRDLNLVAYYNFDQTSGSILPDISGNNNHGDLIGMSDSDWTVSTSFLNKALNFADSADSKYVETSNVIFSSIIEDLTIEFWLGGLSIPYGTVNKIIETLNMPNNTGFMIQFPDANTVQFKIGSQTVSADISDAGFKYGWNYWVFTQNSKTKKINIYLNGYSLFLNNNIGNGDEITNINSGKAYSGQNLINGSQISRVRIGEGYPGKIDELRIWNIARSHSDILEYYDEGYSPLRIVETIKWINANKLVKNVTVGKEITSTFHDKKAPHNGYVFWANSPYNANIYDRKTKQGEIFPVNVFQPNNRNVIGDNSDLYSHDNIGVVWYEMKDNIAWPYQPEEYTIQWPDYNNTDPDRIVIASQIGSEGKDKYGNDQTFPDINDNPQNYLDPARYTNIKIYNQPDPLKPGYNPNEEHAIIAPSYRHAKASPKPFAAFALRNDLNTSSITTSSSITNTTSEPFVLVQYLDQKTRKYGMATFKVEKADPAYAYTFVYEIKAGNPIVPPYPLNFVVDPYPPSEIFGMNDPNLGDQICYWKDHKGNAWAISGYGNTEGLQSAQRSTPNNYILTLNNNNKFMVGDIYIIKVTDNTGNVGTMKFTVGTEISYKDSAVYVNGRNLTGKNEFSVNLNPDIIDLTINNFTLTRYPLDKYVQSYFWYYLDQSFWYKKGNFLAPGDGTNITSVSWLPDPSVIQSGDGFPSEMNGKDKAVSVKYYVAWPDNLPILKAGETLTFAGGEYRADNSTYPGLPGVLGWSSGQVIYDSLNKTMNKDTITTDFLVRFIPILEEKSVSFVQPYPEALQPAGGRVDIVNGRYYFKDLSSNLKNRVFYDSLTKKLGIRGFVNDKTIGDKTLTASPPPIYVVQPNIMTDRELEMLKNISSDPNFTKAVNDLYKLSRDPNIIDSNTNNTNYFAGLEKYEDILARLEASNPNRKDYIKGLFTSWLGANIENNTTRPVPQMCLGPGLALVPNGKLLDTNLTPFNDFTEGYVTLAENNHPDLGALPVTLHIIKVKKDKYRGAIKTIYSDNVFDEKITLRHTADFGANLNDLQFQWRYREADGTKQAPPDISPSVWKSFPDPSGNNGIGMSDVTLTGIGAALLADNLFFVRYRHKNSLNNSEWSDWAGAANSRPPKQGENPSLTYQAQLAEGWIKRVLFEINPFEARIKNFYNLENPATYVSMIQQAGPRYEGPVAFNPAKDVIENIGLIELYNTVFNRGKALSIDSSLPVNSSGITTALLLAASRIQAFYTLLGNEAYKDALDPTIGIGSSSTSYGSLAPTIFTFMNQVPGLLDEELSLLRGLDWEGARPSYNRLLWNFTKGQGEVAYALSYYISDVNKDGFIDEKDAMIMYPQGHGDAWGHYLTALKSYYDLLKNKNYNWESRSELISIQGVVTNVDYLDERKFAETAAAKAKVGSEIVNLTFRSKYVESPEGQWQGYKDTDTNRAWGVSEWGRRAAHGALIDWAVANAILPSQDITHTGIQKVDRTTVAELQEISSHAIDIQMQVDNADTGLNPIGLATDVVPFDIDPSYMFVGIRSVTHFEQISQRAEKSLKNALAIFDYASDIKNRIRKVANTSKDFNEKVIQQDRDYRNKLIEILGTPYEGQIGAGKLYPAAYQGPDYYFYNYIDVNNLSAENVPYASQSMIGFFDNSNLSHKTPTDFTSTNFINNPNNTDPNKDLLTVEFPLSAGKYSFQAPKAWGFRRAPGEIQKTLIELVKAEAELQLASSDYAGLIADISLALDVLSKRQALYASELIINTTWNVTQLSAESAISNLKTTAAALNLAAEFQGDVSNAALEGIPKVVGTATDATSAIRGALSTTVNTLKFNLKTTAFSTEGIASNMETTLQIAEMVKDASINAANYSYEIQQMIKEIESQLGNEAPKRLAVFRMIENMRQISEQYRSVLAKAMRLMDERKAFNAKVAAKVQSMRYEDMAFRQNMNDALSKYRNALDLAAKYVYLAAKAYDYETNLSDQNQASAKPLLTSIVKQRTLGQYQNGTWLVGSGGLGDILSKLNTNFEIIKSQMGLNNPQNETGQFSLRYELFRIQDTRAKDFEWQNVLRQHKVSDLWEIPEFRKFCRPFTSESAGPQPGFVFDFTSNVIFGYNFFGYQLGGGDHAYDPTNYATKIRSVGLWFDNYNNSLLSETPRAYLIPVGMDIMLVPDSVNLATREWSIVDQKIPVPLPTGESDLNNVNWIPGIDGISGSMAEIRRYSSFRAYYITGSSNTDNMNFDSRLVGRSVWNTRWMLIIPGGTFHYDKNFGLNEFINSVTDIKLYFQTYAISGN